MRKHWPELIGYATAVWSLTYGVQGVYWSLGGAGFPFAKVPADRATGSILEGTPADVVAPIMAAVGLGGAVLALVMTRIRPRGLVPQTIAAILAAGLALVIPDYTLVGFVALSPALVVFAFTGVPGAQDLGDILYWHRLNLIILFVGGLLWAATAVAYHRRSRDACVSCGRSDRAEKGWTTPESALRWGRWAVAVSVIANVPYEITRVAWYFGWPLGITDEFHQMMVDTPGMLEVGLGLAVMGIGGGILTHGLVRPWGEVYPRWLWFTAGRRVPPLLAIIPASLVAVVLIPAGLMNGQIPTDPANWAVNLPGILWVVWGAALGTATYGYYLRRRTSCRRCGRGVTSRSGAPAARSSGSPGGSRHA